MRLVGHWGLRCVLRAPMSWHVNRVKVDKIQCWIWGPFSLQRLR